VCWLRVDVCTVCMLCWTVPSGLPALLFSRLSHSRCCLLAKRQLTLSPHPHPSASQPKHAARTLLAKRTKDPRSPRISTITSIMYLADLL